MAQEGSEGGYVLRAADGSLYLIRDEVLEACKMEGDDLEYAQQQEGGGSSKPFSEFRRVDYKDAPRWKKGGGGAEAAKVMGDTTMCGW